MQPLFSYFSYFVAQHEGIWISFDDDDIVHQHFLSYSALVRSAAFGRCLGLGVFPSAEVREYAPNHTYTFFHYHMIAR